MKKFNPDDPSLSLAVKNRIEEVKKNIDTFYDKSTGKIFINENVKDNKARASIAREWKIKEDLENKKGKENTKGQLRATVAGEIAYEEILGRTKGKESKLDINKFTKAEMNPDSRVTSDKLGESVEAIKNVVKAGLEYSLKISEGNDNINSIDEDKEELKIATEKLIEEIKENYDYAKDGWHRLECLEKELPSLEKMIEKEQDPLRKNLLETRKEYLKREKSIVSNLKEAGKGFGEAVIGTAVITAGITTAPVTTTAVLVGGTIVSILNNEESPKVEITKVQQNHLQNVAPEFYRAYKKNFIIGNSVDLGENNKNENSYNTKKFDNKQLLSMAKEFYSNSKTPDEKLSRLAGNFVGGTVTSKSINIINSKEPLPSVSKVKNYLYKNSVKNQLKSIGLKVDGTTVRGLEIDKALGNNLGKTFKTFDHFENGTATSVKSINLKAKTYQSGKGMYYKLNKDLKSINNFTTYELNKVRISNNRINSRVLKIVINNETLNPSQIENLKKVTETANKMGIKVEATILK